MRTIIPDDARLIPPEAKRVFEGIIYDTYHWPQKTFDGSTVTFEMLKRRDSVKVIPVKGDKIVFVEDEQPTHKPSFVFPGGRHDFENETELECAKRELKEETGMTFKNWRLVGVRQPTDEIDWLVYVFVASDLEEEGESHADGGERITLKELSYEDAVAVEPTHATLAFALEILQEAGSIDGLKSFPEYT